MEKFPGDEVWLIEQLDARDAAGFYRKARIMIVERQLSVVVEREFPFFRRRKFGARSRSRI